MRHAHRAVLAALAVLVALPAAAALAGCGGATSPPPATAPSGAADITGVVRDLAPGGDAGSVVLLVVADPGVTTSYDRASVLVTPETTVWAPAGQGTTAATVADLSEGQRVAVWFTGGVAESYPVQATAGDVEILTPLE